MRISIKHCGRVSILRYLRMLQVARGEAHTPAHLNSSYVRLGSDECKNAFLSWQTSTVHRRRDTIPTMAMAMQNLDSLACKTFMLLASNVIII